MIGSAMDMMAQISANTSSSSSSTNKSTSSSSDDKSSGEFGKLMEKHQSESSSDTSTSKNENTEGEKVTEGTTENVAPGDEVTELQMEMMAALSMQTMNFRTVDVVVEPEEVEIDLDLMVNVEEAVVEVPEISLEEEVLVDLPDVVVETSDLEITTGGQFEEAKIVLDDEVVLADTEVKLEAEVEAPVEVEVEVAEETEVKVEVETEDNVSVETEPEVEVEDKVTSDAPVAEHEEVKTEETVVLEENPQGTVVVEKAEARPVKVAETVNTQDPDMDAQVAKIIQQADANGEKSVTIRLTPEGLGTVTAQITHTAEGNLQIILQTTDDAATILLKNHVNQLALTLQGNSQNVSIEVQNTEESHTAEQDLQEQREREHQQQGDDDNQDEQSFVYSEDFMQQLRLGLVKEFTLDITE